MGREVSKDVPHYRCTRRKSAPASAPPIYTYGSGESERDAYLEGDEVHGFLADSLSFKGSDEIVNVDAGHDWLVGWLVG